jgi:hypothetical protein
MRKSIIYDYYDLYWHYLVFLHLTALNKCSTNPYVHGTCLANKILGYKWTWFSGFRGVNFDKHVNMYMIGYAFAHAFCGNVRARLLCISFMCTNNLKHLKTFV